MWKEGILIKTNEGTALMEAIPNKNELLIKIKGKDYSKLLTKIRNELNEINQDEQGIMESVSLDGQTFVLLKDLRNSPIQNEVVQAENGAWVNIADYRMFLGPDEQVRFNAGKDKQPVQPPKDSTPTIYFSYAWRDSTNEDREQFVEELYNSLKKDVNGQYKVIRDKEDLHYRDSISEFMKEIGRGDIVVVAISDKYLRSEYCMSELHELYLNSGSRKEELLKKIFPVRVEYRDLKDPEVLGAYFDHWEQLEKRWEELVTKRASRISPEQQEQYKKIKKIAVDIGSFLDLLADINSLSKELLAENDFAEIKRAIRQRMKEV
jgi:hypothetical protein